MLTRRDFLRCAAIAAAGMGLYAWRVEPQWVEFVQRPLPIVGLPSSLVGKTLVQLADVHVGDVEDEYATNVFARVAALRPDIVALTGDIISCCRGIFDRAAWVYRHFPTGRLATLGNHDYGPRWKHPEIAARLVATLGKFGITVLRNEIHEVEGLRIVGLDDLLAKRFDQPQVLALVTQAAPAVVLSHNPDTVDLPCWEGYRGWILSGHTHGGQCKPPFLRPPVLPCRNPRYTAGEFRLSGSRRLYISRGVGHIWPVRFNVRPEVTVFHLQSA